MSVALTFDGVNEGIHVDPTVWNSREPLDLCDKRDKVFLVFWITIGLPHVAPAEKMHRSW